MKLIVIFDTLLTKNHRVMTKTRFEEKVTKTVKSQEHFIFTSIHFYTPSHWTPIYLPDFKNFQTIEIL